MGSSRIIRRVSAALSVSITGAFAPPVPVPGVAVAAAAASAEAPAGASGEGREVRGYTLTATDGGVFNFGSSRFLGSSASIDLNSPIVDTATTNSQAGTWHVGADGGVFTFGDAGFFGSTGDLRLNQPIVGMASTPTGRGYRLVAGDGGIFSFGDARFFGSTGDLRLNQPIVGMASTPTGRGYWLVAGDGGIFSFGDARFFGSVGDLRLNRPVVAMAATPTGRGYLFVASDGGIFTFGDARFFGSTGDLRLNKPIAAVDLTTNLPPGDASGLFQHVGTFHVPTNLPAGADPRTPTAAEIVDVSDDGNLLVYTDAVNGNLGFVDITDPASPQPRGLLDPGGSPTSVTIVGPWLLAVVSTAEDPDGDGPRNEYDTPAGDLVVVDLATRAIERRVPLGGQPDNIAISPDERYAAIVIENERDEDENDGLIPQLPAGFLQVIELAAPVAEWTLKTVALTGLAEVAPEDPEPEYVDINEDNLAVVSLQENNHLVVIDLPTARVVGDFSAGTVDLSDVDAVEEELGPQGNGVIELSSDISRRREPDTVAWIDHDTFATANEGDYEDADGVEGGSRGFSLFNRNGTLEYESGSSLEHEVVRAGHYPEGRSENKGAEPEGLDVGTYGGRTLLFVGVERANVIAVYDVGDGSPEFLQLLPTGMGPEGIKAIAHRNLVAVSAETDGLDEDPGDQFEVRSLITLYRAEAGSPSYPQLVSADVDGLPIPWVAMSGLAADPAFAGRMWAVSDSYLAQAFIYEIDLSAAPPTVVRRIPVGDTDVEGAPGGFDLEGIVARPEGGFWLASEGRTNAGSSRSNLLVRADVGGAVTATVPLPDVVSAQATSSGFEGVAATGTAAGDDEVVWVAFQREWKDDPEGLVKLGRYEVATGSWTFAHYPLDDVESPNGGWVGLSELTLLPDGTFAIIERDNQIALHARIKRIYRTDLRDVAFAPAGQPLPVVTKTLLDDILGDVAGASISVPDKVEGFAVTTTGERWLVTDNDGVDENYGETVFLRL